MKKEIILYVNNQVTRPINNYTDLEDVTVNSSNSQIFTIEQQGQNVIFVGVTLGKGIATIKAKNCKDVVINVSVIPYEDTKWIDGEYKWVGKRFSVDGWKYLSGIPSGGTLVDTLLDEDLGKIVTGKVLQHDHNIDRGNKVPVSGASELTSVIGSTATGQYRYVVPIIGNDSSGNWSYVSVTDKNTATGNEKYNLPAGLNALCYQYDPNNSFSDLKDIIYVGEQSWKNFATTRLTHKG